MSLSISPPDTNARGFRASMSASCPTRMSTYHATPHRLDTIPHTPSIVDVSAGGDKNELIDPFKQGADYFAFDIGEEEARDEGKERSAGEDLMGL